MSTSSAPLNPGGRPSGLRAGRVVLLSMAAILAILVAVIWILPGMLDWNQYRSSIASLVTAGIGRPVRIDGNITLHLLPQPFLTATDLEVDDAGDGVVLHAKAVRLRVALGPLVSGRVDARELTLQGADLRLPWPPPPGALNRRPPAWITGLQARVEESRLQIGDFVLSAIDASLAADPETGTLSAAGLATLFEMPARFTARVGRPGRDGAAPIDISLDGLGKLRDTGGTISGAVEADGSL
ncbi:MAG: AsmA family protein, partial [Pseudomonadota bacterium]|nr:AsmA family protein [Pseudomonadota bacterium]